MIIPFWIDDISILLNNKYILEVWCNENMQSSQKLNAITRLVIILSILGFVFMQNINFIIMGIITLGTIIGIHYYSLLNKNKLTLDNVNKEGFTLQNNKKTKPLKEELMQNYVEPEPQNPLMNVNVCDFGTSDRERPAEPAFNPLVESKINNTTKQQIKNMHPDIPDLEDKLFKDLGDNFVFSQSMRNFYSMPNTSVPNAQEEFAKFCYGDMQSCKDGDSLACIKQNYRHIN